MHVSPDSAVQCAARDPIWHPNWAPLLRDVVQALNAMQLWGWLACFEPAQGYYSSQDATLNRLAEAAGVTRRTRPLFAMVMGLVQHTAVALGQSPLIECALCIAEPTDTCGMHVARLECGHCFHRECLVQVVERVDDVTKVRGMPLPCPVCRARTVRGEM